MLVCKNAPTTTDLTFNISVTCCDNVLKNAIFSGFLQVTPTLSSSSPQQWLLLLLPHQAWDPCNSR